MEENRFLEMVDTMRASGKYSALRKILCDMNTVDTAQLIEVLEAEDLLRVFNILPEDVSAGVFSYFEPHTQEKLVDVMQDSELETLVENLFIDDTVAFLRSAPADVVKRILARMESDERKRINQHLQYPRFSAGSLMTCEFIELDDSMTVSEAMTLIRKTGSKKETVYVCYCVDYVRRLIGAVPLSRLLLSDDNASIRDIMDSGDKLKFVGTDDDQKKVIDLARKYDLYCLPVVDTDKKLAGIITIDDIIDVLVVENTKDIEKMASLRPSDDKYMQTNLFSLFKNRIPWLLILMIAATFTGLIVQQYESLLTAFFALIVAIPLLTGSGGNAGLQSSATIIRGLTLGEIKSKDYLRVMAKEVALALLCGVALAGVNFARMFFISKEALPLCVAVSAALVSAVLIAKIIGCALPMLAKRAGLKPALVSNTMLTTLIDACTLAVYFALAKVILTVA